MTASPGSPLLHRLATAAALLAAGCVVDDEWPGADADDPVVEPPSDAGALTGTVSGPDGPIAGAVVVAVPGGTEATTADDGTYTIPRLVPGTYHVAVTADGYADGASADVVVADGATADADVALEAEAAEEGVLRVVVLGPDELPRAGALVTAGEISASTDASGRATLVIGAATVDVSVTDPSGRLWSRDAPGVAIPALGGADLAVTLAGRAADGTAYLGSERCALCHGEVAAQWSGTAHASALSPVSAAPAGFAGTTVDLGGPTARLETVGGAPVVTLTAIDGARDTWTVAGFIGGSARGAVPWAERDGVAWPLPVAWVPPEAEHEAWAPGGWVPGPTDAFFAPDGTFAYTVDPPLSASAEASCFGCHATGLTLTDDGGSVRMNAATHAEGRYDEAGVGCEACHGPGVDHSGGPVAEKPLRITVPDDLDPDRGNDVCGQCHRAWDGLDGTPYAWNETHGLFRPGEIAAEHADSAYEAWSSGAAAVPGAQGDELLLSRHGEGAWNARCSDCHDPHGSVYPSDLRLEHQDNTLCLSCHLTRTFHDSAAEVTSHVAHVNAPASSTESGRCTGCHMPATAARLHWSDDTAAGDLASHRFVAIPPANSLSYFDAASAGQLAPGAFEPNACQECHAWNDWLFEGGFPGPAGDMTMRVTHEALQATYEGKFP